MLEVDDENNAGPDTDRKDATTKMNLDLDSNKQLHKMGSSEVFAQKDLAEANQQIQEAIQTP